jgi:prophage regulatory protein
MRKSFPKDARLLSLADLRQQKGLRWSRQWLDQLQRRGKFPKPVKLGDGKAGSLAWLEHEVDAWIAERAEARDHATAR